MGVSVRRAKERDIKTLLFLLGQVLELHAKIRPDIFVSGTTKYTEKELLAIIADEKTPVFVAEDGDGIIKGYVFCKMIEPPFSNNMKKRKTLFIDDLCVDECCRGEGVGKRLFEFAKAYACSLGCDDLTLNVWAGNDKAEAFYKKAGMRVKKTQMELILDENDKQV